MKFPAALLPALPSILLMGQAPAGLSVKREALLATPPVLRLDRVEGRMACFVVLKKLEGSSGEASVPSGSELWVPLKAEGSKDLNWAQSRLLESGTGRNTEFKMVVQPEGSAPGLGDFAKDRVVSLDRARLMALFTAVRAPGSDLVVLYALVDIPDQAGKAAIPAGGGLTFPAKEDKSLDLAKVGVLDAAGKPIPGLRLAFDPRDLKMSPGEFGTLNRIPLTEDLVKEHFRIRSVDPVRSGDGYHRVVLMTTGNIKTPGGGVVFKESAKLIGRLRIHKIRGEERGLILIDPERVLDPDGQPMVSPFSGPPLRIPFEAMVFWSMDDQLSFSWDNKGEVRDLLKERSSDRWLYSSPVDINLYAGAVFSNLFRRPEDKGKGYFFGQKGMFSLEASQTFVFNPGGQFFIRTDLFAMVHPASAVEIRDTTGALKAIQEAQGFQGGFGASFGYMLTEHTSMSVGMQFASRNYQLMPNVANPVTTDKVASQRRVFLRFIQHDPMWRGSFFEFSPNAQDPLFHDPEVPGNETRRYFRGRAAFRPKALQATSFYLEGVVNQSKDGRSGLPDETAIYFGFFVDMKNFSFKWPW